MPRSPATARDDLLDWVDENEPVAQQQASHSMGRELLRTGIVTLGLVVAVVVVLSEVHYFALRAEIRKKQAEPAHAMLLATHARDLQRLNHYQWVDQKAGIVRIPASVAAELVIADYAHSAVEQPKPVASVPGPVTQVQAKGPP